MTSRKAPDLARVEACFAQLLEACGLDRDDPNLAETPRRAAAAWVDTLLSGYATPPGEILAETYPSAGNGAVVVTRIPFLSTCPHHLLPLTGHAHLGFMARGAVPGFGRLTRLVDALAHRLVLQEDLTQSVAQALVDHTDTPASACVLEARHTCVAVVDPARAATVFRTTALSGDPDQAEDLLRQIDTSLRNSDPQPSAPGSPHP